MCAPETDAAGHASVASQGQLCPSTRLMHCHKGSVPANQPDSPRLIRSLCRRYHLLKPGYNIIMVEQGGWAGQRTANLHLQAYGGLPWAILCCLCCCRWRSPNNMPSCSPFPPTSPVTLENRGHHLAEAAAELKQDDGLARRLGAAGAALVANALAPRMVQVGFVIELS